MAPTLSDYDRDWQFLASHMSPNWRAHAKAASLGDWDSPPSPNAKVTDASAPVRMLLFHIGTDSSLKTTAAAAAAVGLLDVSPVAIHKWMKKAAPFFAAVLSESTQSSTTFEAARWGGYELVALDASTVTEPGGTGTTARIHYAMRLTDLRPLQIEVTDEHEGETLRRFRGQPGQLWLGDRVYPNPPGIASMHRSGAHVLLRYNRGALPLYDIQGRRIEVVTKLSRLTKPLRVRQWAAWVHADGCEPIRGRLCALRLPEEKAEQARTRLRKEYGTAVSAESLEMAAYVVVFTTVPADRLSAEQVLELYRIRWQVELRIKRDKSIVGLKKLPNFRSDTIAAWLLGKLLLAQITRAVADQAAAIPPSGDEFHAIAAGRPRRTGLRGDRRPDLHPSRGRSC